MENAKKKSSTSKSIKKVKKALNIDSDLDLDEDLDEETLEDVDFNLDDDEDELSLLENQLEEISSDERLIRVEKQVKISIILQAICLILIIVTLGICISIKGSGVKNGSSSKTNAETNETEDGEKNTYATNLFKEIKVSEVTSVSKNKEIIVFIGRQGCYWCSLYAPVLGLASEDYKFDVYYIDFGKMVDFSLAKPAVSDEEQYNALIDWFDAGAYANEVADGIGTPMTIFVKNGKMVNFIGGYVDGDTLNTYLKKEGFIK